MNEIYFKNYVDFINRYRTFQVKNSSQLWEQQKPIYKKFLLDFSRERDEKLLRDKKNASFYNVFSILKLHFSEVKAHTPIIANLLNPQGSHDQGTLFFQSFIHNCLPLKWGKFAHVKPYELYVRAEKRTPYGQVDIFLRSTSPSNPFVIIIENKIYAKDQFRQLFRYFQYAHKGLGLSLDQICIVYLSPDGRSPSMEDLIPFEIEQLNQVLAPPISYQTHFIKAIEDSINEDLPGNVKHTIKQYIQTFKYL